MRQNHTRKFRKQISPVRILFLFYFLAVTSSALLLSMPIFHVPDVSIPLIDHFFTAVSALSVTGLSTVEISEVYNTMGIILIAIILQLGAVGVMAIGTFFWLILGKRIGITERRLIQTDQNQTTGAGMVRLIIQIAYLLLIIELVGFIILGTYLLNYYPTVKEAYLHGFFGVISALSNGGFDITGQSLILYKNEYFIQSINMILIVLGAIGFPVLIEIKQYLRTDRKKRNLFRFSLFTKLTSVTFLLLIVIGAIVIYILDYNHFFAGLAMKESFFYSLFQSVTTRSGGLSTLPVEELSLQNHLFMSLLMFIGASPSSAGGGIRTTTFALVIIFLLTYARGGKSVRLFKREVYREDLIKAVTVTLMALILVYVATFIISIFESFSLIEILFEVTSAFGTVGLSLGITSHLTTASKVVLMVLMFIGRVGVITFLFTFRQTGQTGEYRYPKERIIIG